MPYFYELPHFYSERAKYKTRRMNSLFNPKALKNKQIESFKAKNGNVGGELPKNLFVKTCSCTQMHCAEIEPATPCAVGEYSHHYAKSAY
jgi:hypothetical protein